MYGYARTESLPRSTGGRYCSRNEWVYGRPRDDQGEIEHPVSVTFDGRDAVESAAGVTFDVEVLESAVTDEHTARISIETTNSESGNEILVFDCCPSFGRSHGGDVSPSGLWLHQDYRHEWLVENDHRTGDLWVLDRPQDQHRVFTSEGPPSHTFEPNETVSYDYYVWHDYRESGYFEPGTYRWETEFSVSPPDGREDASQYPLGFSIAIE